MDFVINRYEFKILALPFTLSLILDKGSGRGSSPRLQNLRWSLANRCLVRSPLGIDLEIILAFLFFSPHWLWAYLSIPTQKESMLCISFSCNPLLYWSTVGMIVRCRGRKVFYNLLTKSQSFGRLHLWPVTFTSITSYMDSPTSVLQTRGAGVREMPFHQNSETRLG